MVKVGHLVVLQAMIVYVQCSSRFTSIRQKHDIFNKNHIGRLSTGFGKRVQNTGTSSHNEMTNTGKDVDADNAALFNNLVGRLSTGYGKRAEDIYEKLKINGLQKISGSANLRRYDSDDFVRQSLINILKVDVMRNRETVPFDDDLNEERTNEYPYSDVTDTTVRDWLAEATLSSLINDQ